MIDPQEMAKTELAKAMVPTPDDVMEALSPIASLYYLEQMAWGVLTNWAANTADAADDGGEAAEGMATVLNGIAEVCGRLDAICAPLGLIPADQVTTSPARSGLDEANAEAERLALEY